MSKTKNKQARRITFSLKAGQRVMVDDIDGWQEFVMDFLEDIPGTTGEEYYVKTLVKVNVVITWMEKETA